MQTHSNLLALIRKVFHVSEEHLTKYIILLYFFDTLMFSHLYCFLVHLSLKYVQFHILCRNNQILTIELNQDFFNHYCIPTTVIVWPTRRKKKLYYWHNPRVKQRSLSRGCILSMFFFFFSLKKRPFLLCDTVLLFGQHAVAFHALCPVTCWWYMITVFLLHL